jgi:hypothetical protein
MVEPADFSRLDLLVLYQLIIFGLWELVKFFISRIYRTTAILPEEKQQFQEHFAGCINRNDRLIKLLESLISDLKDHTRVDQDLHIDLAVIKSKLNGRKIN